MTRRVTLSFPLVARPLAVLLCYGRAVKASRVIKKKDQVLAPEKEKKGALGPAPYNFVYGANDF